MNYKKLVELEKKEQCTKDNDQFFCCFLDTVHLVNYYSKMLKNVHDNENKKRIKQIIKNGTQTLRCFLGCLNKEVKNGI